MSGSEVYRDSEAMVDYYEQLIREFPILSIEDGLFEDDWDGWKMLTERLGEQVHWSETIFCYEYQTAGCGIKLGVANAILIKAGESDRHAVRSL